MENNLIEIIKRGEDSQTQFKLRFDSVDALAAEISAMANSKGGIILVPRLISSVRDFGNLTLETEDALRQPWLKVLCS